jgi:hypothetical protein
MKSMKKKEIVDVQSNPTGSKRDDRDNPVDEVRDVMSLFGAFLFSDKMDRRFFGGDDAIRQGVTMR